MTAREDARAKARRLLGEGRVLLVRVVDRDVDAVVRGDEAAFYRVTHRAGSWSCSCPAVGTLCSHTRAAMLVTVPQRRTAWRPASDAFGDFWADAPVEPWERSAPAHRYEREADRGGKGA